MMFAFAIHTATTRSMAPWEAPYLNGSFALHVTSGIGQVLLVEQYYGFGDMLEYFRYGVPMAETLRHDFFRFAPVLFQAFLRTGELSMPVELAPGGETTQSTSALAGFGLFFCGNSLYAVVLAIATLSYLSKVMIYRAVRDDFEKEGQKYVLIGATLLPTAAFWSSALLKEPIIMIMLGPLVLGLRWMGQGRRRGLAIPLVLASAVVVALIKPYVLMALSVAAGAFHLWSRAQAKQAVVLKPFALVTAAAIGMSGFMLGNRYLARGEGESTMSSLATQRQRGYQIEGGSNYSLGDTTEDGGNRSVMAELVLVPLALFTALFRPLLFEARNLVQLANAIEATWLLVLFVTAWRRYGFANLAARILESPVLLFCAVFTLAMAVGTGLASTNLGTLSRYRAPMTPFYFILLLCLRYGISQRRPAAAVTPPPTALARA